MIPLAPFHFLIFYIAVTAIYKQAARRFSSQAINSSLAREYIVFRDLDFVPSAQSFLPTANPEFIICGEQSGQPEGWRIYISVSFFSFLGTQTQNETLQFSKLTPISFYSFSSLLPSQSPFSSSITSPLPLFFSVLLVLSVPVPRMRTLFSFQSFAPNDFDIFQICKQLLRQLLNVQFIYLFLFNALRNSFRWLLSFHCALMPRLFCMFILLREWMDLTQTLPAPLSNPLDSQICPHPPFLLSLALWKRWHLVLAPLLSLSPVSSSIPPGNISRYL